MLKSLKVFNTIQICLFNLLSKSTGAHKTSQSNCSNNTFVPLATFSKRPYATLFHPTSKMSHQLCRTLVMLQRCASRTRSLSSLLLCCTSSGPSNDAYYDDGFPGGLPGVDCCVVFHGLLLGMCFHPLTRSRVCVGERGVARSLSDPCSQMREGFPNGFEQFEQSFRSLLGGGGLLRLEELSNPYGRHVVAVRSGLRCRRRPRSSFSVQVSVLID